MAKMVNLIRVQEDKQEDVVLHLYTTGMMSKIKMIHISF